ncbi:alpha/beta hydrolase [Leptolyngbya sp. FACHB-711]|uniref:alpha/beta fold hydrolase n=1 Tax=unclassified Leptolyngbya TaxID=2650499 RepID=UPI00168812C8|nr:alpha/beta hydrolase [Leptolyngbya sp. FACHB-711]MBD1849011.1 alpha/beta fold hydrolase [Cyanobacteria bacterium FACHB-502]MBD2026095.1 alpha/beta fold hydrolase [Leptolyngbya sp. FACHB-711]
MSLFPDALWLNVSPAFQGFNRPLLNHLSQHAAIGHWEYAQDLDEPTSLDTALVLLHDYLKHHNRPIHLLGHSTGGLLGLLYARQHPERVRSLTLLSVGVNPTIDWQMHYYTQRRLLPCDQQRILRQMVHGLLGCPSKDVTETFVKLLEQDLYQSLSPHSLFRSTHLLPISVSVPLLVCGSVDDMVIDPNQLRDWQQYFDQSISRLWICPGGRYFFHYFYAQLVSEQIANFWGAAALHQRSVISEELLDLGV